MKKTKIVCTMGPNTNDPKVMRALAENGMNVARFNFSHGDHEEQLERVEILRNVRKETGIPVAALLDTKGPEIRTGALKGGNKVTLEAGNKYTLTVNEVEGDETISYINYPTLLQDVKVGSRILIDDGLIELEVCAMGEDSVECTILNGGELGSKKGVNIPNIKSNLPALTEKDRNDILFAIEQDFDFIAASFVRNAAGVLAIREILDAHNSKIKIISKIENAEGVENLDEIIAVSDGLMVARGDLGVEIPAELVPLMQKTMIKKCNAAGKPVITATQMLDSMMRNPRPTRAEVTDIANAIYDGTDAIMLSGETAMGKYPIEAVTVMRKVANVTEADLDYTVDVTKHPEFAKNTADAVSLSSVATANNIGAKAIIAPTLTGFTAERLSNWRPGVPVIAVCPNENVVRQMELNWGVVPVTCEEGLSTEELIAKGVEFAKANGVVASGDTVVVTSGVPTVAGQRAETNNMRVITVE